MSSFVIQFIGYRIVLPVLVLACGLAEVQTDRVPEVGDRAPNFSITTDHGKRISPDTPGRGVLVLNSWETSCAPCVAELPSLSAFAHKFRSNQVVVVAVSGDEDARKYHRFLRGHGIALETYRDPTRHISQSFGTIQFPDTYIIQDGRIVRKVVGSIDWMNDDMASFVNQLLGR